MENLINIQSLMSAIIFSLLGCAVFAVAFKVIDLLTPNDMWNEILEEHNNALAIVIGSVAIGIAIIISASIRG
ncbi:MAG: DUF350 domain-containing protein [Halobacteriovoraceae bacterium]|jgi:putative membrane protein|nr:DUF350 domain-containing protein [Halobacteriovoraceae bacterium]